MRAVSLRLPEELIERLNQLAATTDRSKTFYMIEAIKIQLASLEKKYAVDEQNTHASTHIQEARAMYTTYSSSESHMLHGSATWQTWLGLNAQQRWLRSECLRQSQLVAQQTNSEERAAWESLNHDAMVDADDWQP